MVPTPPREQRMLAPARRVTQPSVSRNRKKQVYGSFGRTNDGTHTLTNVIRDVHSRAQSLSALPCLGT